MKEIEPHFYKFDDFQLDLKGHQLSSGDRMISLTPKAFQVLVVLVSRNGELVSKEDLFDKVWSETFVEESSLTKNISVLRKAFAPKEYIKTVPRLGYKFTADVFEIGCQEESKSNKDNTSQEISESNVTFPFDKPAAPSKSNKRWTLLTIVLVGIFLLSSFSIWVSQRGVDSGLPELKSPDSVKSIAVLPFKTFGSDEKSKIFAFGLTDNLTSRLSGLNHFAVRPISAVEGFNESGKSALKFGKELKVDAVVVGTVQKIKNHYRVSVRMLDLRDERQLWASNFDKAEKDVFELQDEVSAQIATILITRPKRGDQKLAADHTRNFDAYRAYRQGRFYLQKRTSKSIVQAIKFFEQATKLDDKYFIAYLGLAECYLLQGDSDFGDISPVKIKKIVTDTLEKATILNPKSPRLFMVKGFFEMNINWDIRKSEELYKKAISLNPNLSKAHHWYAWNLIAQKRFNEAKEKMRLAQELNPTSKIIASEMSIPSVFQKDFKTAISLSREAVEMDKFFPEARFQLWYSLFFSGDYKKSLEELDDFQKTFKEDVEEGDAIYLIARGITLSSMGNKTEAREIFNQIIKIRNSGEYVSPVALSPLAYEVGESDQAFRLLEEGFAERNEYLLYLGVSPEFADIRKDQRYKKLKERIDET